MSDENQKEQAAPESTTELSADLRKDLEAKREAYLAQHPEQAPKVAETVEEEPIAVGDPIIYIGPSGHKFNAVVLSFQYLPVEHCVKCRSTKDQVISHRPCLKKEDNSHEIHEVRVVHNEPLVTLQYVENQETVKQFDVKHHLHPAFDEANEDLPRIAVNCWAAKGEKTVGVPKDSAHYRAHHPGKSA